MEPSGPAPVVGLRHFLPFNSAVSALPALEVDPSLLPTPGAALSDPQRPPPPFVDEAGPPPLPSPEPAQAEMAPAAASGPPRPHPHLGPCLMRSVTRLPLSPSVEAIEREMDEELQLQLAPAVVTQEVDVAMGAEMTVSPLMTAEEEEAVGQQEMEPEGEAAFVRQVDAAQWHAQTPQPTAATPPSPMRYFYPPVHSVHPPLQLHRIPVDLTNAMGPPKHTASHPLQPDTTTPGCRTRAEPPPIHIVALQTAPPPPPTAVDLAYPVEPRLLAPSSSPPPQPARFSALPPYPARAAAAAPPFFHSASQLSSAQALHLRVQQLHAQLGAVLGEYDEFIRTKAPLLSAAEATFLDHRFRATHHHLQYELNQTCAMLDGTVRLITAAEVPTLHPLHVHAHQPQPHRIAMPAHPPTTAAVRLERGPEQAREPQGKEEKVEQRCSAERGRDDVRRSTKRALLLEGPERKERKGRMEGGLEQVKADRGGKKIKRRRDADEPPPARTAYIVHHIAPTSLIQPSTFIHIIKPAPQLRPPPLCRPVCACVVSAVPRGPHESLASGAP